MFGFDDIAGFAHNLETAFDRLRNGQLAATADLINLTLAAGDQIKTMLDEAAGRGTVGPRPLRQHSRGTAPADGLAGAAAGTQRPLRRPRRRPPAAARLCDWRIRFRPGPDVLLNGTNPLLLFRELRELGQLQIDLDTAAIPPLGEIDPERCYLAWDMVLTTPAAPEAIRDVFIFVEDDCELTIERAPGQAVAPACAGGCRRPGRASRTGAPAAGAGTASSIRVSADKLDQLVNLVGELVTVQARLSEVAGRRDDPDILDISEEVDRLTAALRENSMSIRMLPLQTTFERFRRLVHDLGIELHKEVELTIEGADTELDKTVIDQLNDPLVHLIRNSMDHGIETPEARRAAGKRPTADHSPFGAALRRQRADPGERRRTRPGCGGGARPRDRAGPDRRRRPAFGGRDLLSDPGARLLHRAGGHRRIRTGRGHGRGPAKHGGTARIHRDQQQAGSGAHGDASPSADPGHHRRAAGPRRPGAFRAAAGQQPGMRRTDPPGHPGRARQTPRQRARRDSFPTSGSASTSRWTRARPEREQIMVVETEHGHYGFVVDEVLGDHQTVIKNLGRLYRNVQVVSGATILGNGTVALILDPHRLVQNVVQGVSQKSADGRTRRSSSVDRQDSRQRTYSFKKEDSTDGT